MVSLPHQLPATAARRRLLGVLLALGALLAANTWPNQQAADAASVAHRAALLRQGAYVKASNTGVNDRFGWSIALSGNTMVIGAPGEDSSATGVDGPQANDSANGAGAAYVFVRDGTTWRQQAYLKASNTGAGDQFGARVAISGDTIVIGAEDEDSAAIGVGGDQADNAAEDAGAAYVFVRSGTTWSQQAYLKASNTGAGDGFGYAVGIAGETVVVSAYHESSAATGIDGDQTNNSANLAGAAYVFGRSGTTWSQQAYLKASNTGAGDDFGRSVAIDGDTIAVGALLEDSAATGIDGDQASNGALNSGAAYVFVRSGTTWSQQAYVKASNTGADDDFGGVALDGDTLVVSAAGEDSAATGVNGNQTSNSAASSGAAYVFVRSGTTWSQQAYLKASNTEATDYFSSAVAIDGDRAVIGAYFESSGSTGINGNQSNNGAGTSGAAYVFTREGGAWRQDFYVKASNTGVGDFFGNSVAANDGQITIGAPEEDSGATGADGDQADNTAPNSGAAYWFTALDQQAYLPMLQSCQPLLIATINPTTIPVQPAPAPGTPFYQTTIALPVTLPSGGTFVLSGSRQCREPGLVDDGLIMRVGSQMVFSYDYGATTRPTPVLVTVPRSILETNAGRAVTVAFVDLHGSVVQASPLYLLWLP